MMKEAEEVQEVKTEPVQEEQFTAVAAAVRTVLQSQVATGE